MIVLVVNFTVKDGKIEEFLTTMTPLIAGSQAEAGCIEYNLCAKDEEPNAFVLLEKFQDQAALDFHNESAHFKQYASKLGDLCDNITAGRFAPVNTNHQLKT